MSSNIASANQRSYHANEHDTVLSEVSRVICVLLPRAYLIAGFNGDGQAVMLRYQDYPTDQPAWDVPFFEQEFMNEPLLGVPQQVVGVFVGTEEGLLVPASVYEESTSGAWLRQLFATSPGDVIRTYAADTAEARYVFAVPAAMDRLIARYFEGTQVLPLAAYQFYRPSKSGYVLQYLATGDRVIGSLHQQGKLLWHQQFEYAGAEDLAWQAVFLCRELHIPRIDIQVQFSALSDSCYDLGLEMERYFPKIKWSMSQSRDEGQWAPALFLLQQLYACAL